MTETISRKTNFREADDIWILFTPFYDGPKNAGSSGREFHCDIIHMAKGR